MKLKNSSTVIANLEPGIIDELRSLRKDALRLNSGVLEHLKTFQLNNNSFVTLPPPFSKPREDDAKISVASTCTALMALVAIKSPEQPYKKLWSRIEGVPENTSVDIPELFWNLVKAEWASSELPDGNAFTTALVVRTAGFLVESKILKRDEAISLMHRPDAPKNKEGKVVSDPEIAAKSLKDIIELKAKFRHNPQTKIEEAPFSVSGYPAKTSIGYWFVDGAIKVDVPLDDDLKKIAEWAKAEFHRQLIYVSARNDSLMDPPELAMAACLINRIHRLCDQRVDLADLSRLLPSQVELGFALERVLLEQPESGIWHKYFPLFHFPGGGGAADYCFSFEFLEAALIEFGKSLLQKPKILERFRRSLLWCDRHFLRYVTSGNTFLGWNSGGEVRALAAGAPECWATAAVHMFLNQLHLKISELLDDLVLKSSFGKDRIRTVNQAGAKAGESKEKSLPESEDVLKKQIDVPIQFPNEPATSLLDVVRDELIANVINSEDSDPFRLGVPRSALLFGPPGTSKTGVANAIAESVGWPIVTITPSRFLGSGLERVHAEVDKVFTDLMDMRKAVVFFDEMDALARTREKGPDDKNKNPLDMTSLLLTTSMLPKLADLWKQATVVFLMATNHRQQLDPAIIRANRFDLLLCVGPPRWEEKKAADKLKRVFKVANEDSDDVRGRLNELVEKDSKTEQLLDLFTVPELGVFFEHLRRSSEDKSLLSALEKYKTAAEFSTVVKEWAKSGIALSDKSTNDEYKADFSGSRRQYSAAEEEQKSQLQKQQNSSLSPKTKDSPPKASGKRNKKK